MEKLQFFYTICKDRLLLFAATVGASLTGYMQSHEVWLKIVFLVGSVIGVYGVIKNLAKINRIEESLHA